jgi:hypothetical protein
MGRYVEEIYGPWDDEVQQRFHDRWLATAHPEVIETERNRRPVGRRRREALLAA